MITSSLGLIKREIKKIFFKGRDQNPASNQNQQQNLTPSWRTELNELPWFDRPDALEVLQRKFDSAQITEEQYLHLKKWVVDGYCILDNIVDTSDIDNMISTLDQLWTANKAIPNLTLLGVRREKDAELENLSHEEILKIKPEIRKKMPSLSNWRIHEFWAQNEYAKNLFQNKKIHAFCDLIFGKSSYARSTINFMYGSSQEIHQDMAVFHIYPHNYLIGVWIACEDIHPDSGPLVYYPGSHKIPFFSGFSDYPQTQLRTLPQDQCDKYYAYLHEEMKKFERKEFIAKKGQVFIWHGGLVHGGSAIKNSNLTRKSFVVHYLAHGVDRTPEIKGPFNWL